MNKAIEDKKELNEIYKYNMIDIIFEIGRIALIFLVLFLMVYFDV